MTEQTLVKAQLPKSLVVFMAASVGLIVANTYYIQPLLAEIGRTFQLDSTGAGYLAMMTQAGTALGMLTLVPLGDTKERRRLIVSMLACATVALIAVANARGVVWMTAACFAVGVSGATVHLILPYAAHLAPDHERGRVVGVVLSGLLLGILLARTVSGVTGAELGWRSVYWLAAGLMVILALLTHRLLPPSTPSIKLTYLQLMRSVWSLISRHPELRESSLIGALLFSSFSAFWTTLVFLLEHSYGYGAAVAGLFGLIGAIGAAGAPLVGRFTDRVGPRKTILYALLVTMAAFGIMLFGAVSLPALIVGVVLMDFGVQAGHVANQTRIYGLDAQARSRLNTVYMFSYFSGGACGSLIASYLWRQYGWTGVCLYAIAALTLALARLLMTRTRTTLATR